MCKMYMYMYLVPVLFTECLVLRAGGSGLGQFSLQTGDLRERKREGGGGCKEEEGGMKEGMLASVWMYM